MRNVIYREMPRADVPVRVANAVVQVPIEATAVRPVVQSAAVRTIP